MIKTAIFVEGQTELIFVREFLLKIFNYSNINLACYNLFSQDKFHETDYSFPNEFNSNAEFYFQIINVGNDNAVLSRILKREKYIWDSGFNTIIGLRDMYSKSYRTEARGVQISEELNIAFKEATQEVIDADAIQSNNIHFIFAIMEVEAWFLGLENIFKKLDKTLTTEYINEKLGFDLKNLDPETIFFHPAATIDEIYALANLSYGKKSTQVHALVSYMTKDDFDSLHTKNKCASFSAFYNTLPKV